MKNFLIRFLATGFFSGYLPVAPGTYGTIVAIPFFWLLAKLTPLEYISVTILAVIFACYVSDEAGKIFGEIDCQLIVIDEIVGFLVTMALVPRTWFFIAAGFAIFRILDSWKPWPIRLFEEIPGGVGVVADDVAAGLVGNILLQLYLHFYC